MATLNEKQAALFTDRNWSVIATIREDGSPHATPVWIDYDGENVLVNSAYGRTKVTNIERDPRATVGHLLGHAEGGASSHDMGAK